MKTCRIETNETVRSKRRKPSPDLALIASKQKALIWLTPPWVAFGFAPVPISLAGLEAIGFWIVHVACIVVCCQLAQSLRKNPVMWTCLALVPLVNLVAIARLSANAAKVLKENGIRSGITGAMQSRSH